jgi:hypothetical protein
MRPLRKNLSTIRFQSKTMYQQSVPDSFSPLKVQALRTFWQAQEPHNRMILGKLERDATEDTIVITSPFVSGVRLAQQVEWVPVAGFEVVVLDVKGQRVIITAPTPSL